MVIKMGADGQICDSISYVGTVLRGNTKLKQEDVLIPASWLTDALISATHKCDDATPSAFGL